MLWRHDSEHRINKKTKEHPADTTAAAHAVVVPPTEEELQLQKRKIFHTPGLHRGKGLSIPLTSEVKKAYFSPDANQMPTSERRKVFEEVAFKNVEVIVRPAVKSSAAKKAEALAKDS